MNLIRPFDPWRSPLCTCPPKYSLHPYTGCTHKCLYCYASAYVGYKDSVPKKDFIKRLYRELPKVNKLYPIVLSTSSDPYPPLELKTSLTRRTLNLLISNNFKIQIVTKSDIVVRDLDTLKRGRVTVSITITTLDERIAKIIEPNAPSPKKRLNAIKILSKEGIPVSVRIDPVIPYLTDDSSDLKELVEKVVEVGASHIVTSTYKARYDNLARMIEAFPDLTYKLKKMYIEEGVRMHGYFYLKKSLREKMLKPVTMAAKNYGITYATCREGLLTKEYFNAPSCDGTHLIYMRKRDVLSNE